MPNNYPIILAHGIARFDFLLQYFVKNASVFGIDLEVGADGLHYFKNVASHLRSHGFDVYHSSVSFAAGVEKRAEDLRAEVNKVLTLRGKEKVHIIAHSMGGLDARHMIVRHEMAERVASVTTIGTPHLGTSFADWGMNNQGHDIIKVVSTVIDIGGFADLTTAACRSFNEEARNSEATNSVIYQTYASSEERAQIFSPLQPAWDIIVAHHEGDNDGLVPSSSQSWAARLESDAGVVKTIAQHAYPVQADHLNEIGWWDINQLKKDWWKTDIFHAVKNYELSIRNVFLEIASNLPQE